MEDGQFSEPTACSSPSSSTKLYVGGLSLQVTDNLLRQYMSTFGQVDKLTIIKKGGKSQCFGYIQFQSPIVAAHVVQTTHILEGKEFNCKYYLAETKARNYSKEEKERKVFVSGLTSSSTDKDLRYYFEQFGPIEWTTINKHLNGQSKCTGFVLFQNLESARAVLSTKDVPLIIKGQRIQVFESLTKKEIEAHKLEQSYISRHTQCNNNFRNTNCNLLAKSDVQENVKSSTPSSSPGCPMPVTSSLNRMNGMVKQSLWQRAAPISEANSSRKRNYPIEKGTSQVQLDKAVNELRTVIPVESFRQSLLLRKHNHLEDGSNLVFRQAFMPIIKF